MAKKENPNLVFRREWWDQLRHKKPELFKESLTLLFSVYFDGKEFDPYIFDEQGTEPTPAEEVIIPMVKTAIADRDAYIAKCERNAANAKKKSESQANANDRLRSHTTACDRMRTQGNIIEGNVMEGNVMEDNVKKVVLLGDSSPQTTKTKQLFDVSFFYLSKGITKPVTHYNQALDYNETHGWKEIKANGTADHSDDKVAYLKGWARKIESTISPAHGQLFCDLCEATSLYNEGMLDSFRGVRCDGDFALFLFDNKTAKETFINHFKGKTDQLVRASDILSRYGFEGKNFTAICEK